MIRVLVVDDHPVVRHGLVSILKFEKDMELVGDAADVREGIAEPVPISSMPGVVQHTRDSLRQAAAEAAELGIGGVMLFGVPQEKDATGSGADIVRVAIRRADKVAAA